jgi:hypothetical protein
MGHATIALTIDLYGHLMPGNENEAAEMLDAYLAGQRQRADDAVRAGTQMGQTVVPFSGRERSLAVDFVPRDCGPGPTSHASPHVPHLIET